MEKHQKKHFWNFALFTRFNLLIAYYTVVIEGEISTWAWCQWSATVQWASAGPWVVGHWKLVPSFIQPRPRRSLVTVGWTRDTCYIGSHLAQDTCTSLGVLEISILTYEMTWGPGMLVVPNECFASPSKMRWCDMNMRNQGMRPATKLQAATLWCQSPGDMLTALGLSWRTSDAHSSLRKKVGCA